MYRPCLRRNGSPKRRPTMYPMPSPTIAPAAAAATTTAMSIRLVVAAKRAAATRTVSPGRGTPALSSATTTEMIQGPWTWIKRIRELENETKSIFNVGLLRPTGLIRTVAALRHDTFEVGVSAIFKSGLRQPAWQVSVLNDYCEGGAAPRAS